MSKKQRKYVNRVMDWFEWEPREVVSRYEQLYGTLYDARYTDEGINLSDDEIVQAWAEQDYEDDPTAVLFPWLHPHHKRNGD